jgi:hypothetical protein
VPPFDAEEEAALCCPLMVARRVAFLLMLAGCGQVIGIRELGVEPRPAAPFPVDSGPPPVETHDADSAPPPPDAGSDAKTCTSPDVAGHWEGTFTATGGGSFGVGNTQTTGQADLQQSCTFVSGSMTIDGCLPAGRVLGTIDENGGFDGTLTSGTIIVTLQATLVDPRQLQGQFTMGTTSISCYAPNGTFQIYRP